MELSLRQKKLLAAAARKIVKSDYDAVNAENSKAFCEAVQPVVRDAVMDAAPEIQKAEAGKIAVCLIYCTGWYLSRLSEEKADKDKGKKKAPAKKSTAKKAPAKPAAKKATKPAKKAAAKKGGKNGK